MNQQESPYQGLLYSIFQQPRAGTEKGVVVAITSSVLGEGVSHVSRNVSAELAGRSAGRILEIDLGHLQQGSPSLAATPLVPVASSPLSNVFQLRAATSGSTGATGATGVAGVVPDGWQRSLEYRQECVSAWRANFAYTIIDCPPLLGGGEALSVARLIDGYLVVVEADRTRSKQIEYVESLVEHAGGTLLGFVLNKRRYLIPEFIFRHL